MCLGRGRDRASERGPTPCCPNQRSLTYTSQDPREASVCSRRLLALGGGVGSEKAVAPGLVTWGGGGRARLDSASAGAGVLLCSSTDCPPVETCPPFVNFLDFSREVRSPDCYVKSLNF